MKAINNLKFKGKRSSVTLCLKKSNLKSWTWTFQDTLEFPVASIQDLSRNCFFVNVRIEFYQLFW